MSPSQILNLFQYNMQQQYNLQTLLFSLTRHVLLPDERSFEEDAQILGVIEAYCLSSKTRHTLNSSK